MAGRRTVRERIEAARRREAVGQVPFTIYPGMIPWDSPEAKRLQELGLGIMQRVFLLAEETPHVVTERVRYEEQGAHYARTTLKTPVGEVFCTQRLGAAYGSSWYVDHFIKRPEDYRVMEFVARDGVYRANYEPYLQAVKELGDAGYVSGNFGYSPLMDMRVNLLGIERFAMDQFDYPELFFSLLEALTENQRQAFPLLADSPADLVIYCGNCVPEVLGKGFAQYCLPCYNELGELLHARGKQLGCHLDANNAYWAKDVAASQLDVIEAFTPAPDTDMSLADARAAWPDKVMWINFPSSLHLAPAARVKEETRRLLAESAPNHEGLIVGITENIPEDRWATSLLAIAEVLAGG